MPATPERAVIESMLQIADKAGNDVPFILNSAQRQIDDNLTGRDLIPKARQEGVSSYFLGLFLVRCLGKRNTRAVVISHDMESTQRLLTRVKYMIDNIRGPKPEIHNLSKTEITFPKTDSMFYIGTAGARKFGRGDTITDLHCSEYAYWHNPVDLIAGLFQAVPMGTGSIALESTGNGMNDYYHRCMRAVDGDSQWKVHFLPWHTFEEYTIAMKPAEAEEFISTLRPDLEEPSLSGTLSPGQLLWRRRRLDDLNWDLNRFKQEYPMTLSECFQYSGEGIFHKILFAPTDEWREAGRGLFLLDGHPVEGNTYVLGADTAAGIEKDYSVAEIICFNTMEQVGEYRSNKVTPDRFATRLVELGLMFEKAYMVVEQNNHGLVTMSYLYNMYPRHLLYRDRNAPATHHGLMSMGVRTTTRTKPLLIGNLRTLLAEELVIHSDILDVELSTFVEDETGKLGAAGGCHDDTVMAMACAAFGLQRAGMLAGSKLADREPSTQAALNPFLVENILKELHNNKDQELIRDQHRSAYSL